MSTDRRDRDYAAGRARLGLVQWLEPGRGQYTEFFAFVMDNEMQQPVMDQLAALYGREWEEAQVVEGKRWI